MSISQNFGNVSPSLLLDFANTKTLDRRITFTRSTPACHYDGKTTAMAEQNMLLRSQDWSASWGFNTSATTVTANSTTAPDGTNTATQFSIASTTSLLHYSEQSISSATGLVTISCYFKANTQNYLNLAVYQSGFGYAHAIAFDLSTGTITKNTTIGSVTNVSSSITSVGSGWYRITVTANFPTSLATYLIFSTNSVSVPTYNYQGILETYAGTIGQSFYVWGAQLEQRNAATAYTATTTQPITNYIPVLLSAGGNQPRFDCNPTTGESLGLLIEEQRTNNFTYSSEFDNAAWSKGNTTISANTIVAPDGTLTGDKLVETTFNGSHNVVQDYTYTGTLTASIYVKAGGRSSFVLNAGNQSGVAATFDISTSTVSNIGGAVSSTSITSVGNAWYRCSMSWTNSSTVGLGLFLVSGGTSSYAGDGFSGMFIWGAQLEAGSFATSYIATTSASATRTADAASMTGINFSSWYNNAEWTLYTETTFTNTNSSVVISIDDGSFNNIARIGSYLNDLFTNVYSNSAFQFNVVPVSSLTRDVFYKIGFAAKPNSYAAIANTNTLITQNSGILFTGAPYQMTIGNYWNGDPFTGRIKKIAYYPIRVSDTNVQALTS